MARGTEQEEQLCRGKVATEPQICSFSAHLAAINTSMSNSCRLLWVTLARKPFIKVVSITLAFLARGETEAQRKKVTCSPTVRQQVRDRRWSRPRLFGAPFPLPFPPSPYCLVFRDYSGVLRPLSFHSALPAGIPCSCWGRLGERLGFAGEVSMLE